MDAALVHGNGTFHRDPGVVAGFLYIVIMSPFISQNTRYLASISCHYSQTTPETTCVRTSSLLISFYGSKRGLPNDVEIVPRHLLHLPPDATKLGLVPDVMRSSVLVRVGVGKFEWTVQ